MVQKFQSHLDSHFPRLKRERLVLALSGGLDSCVLLDLCLAVGLRPAIAHCNFQLRGSESDEDAHWVKALAQEKGLRGHIKNFDTKAYSETHKISIQMAAREQRYTWFDQLCVQEGFTAVLVAHHADDAVETFLINALRGSGLKGLLGIPESRGNILRPLLPFKKETLLAYAKEHLLSWREDASNVTNDYLRNAIRHKVIPQLEGVQPEALTQIRSSIQHLKGANDFIVHALGALKKELFETDKNNFNIAIPALKALVPLDFCLHELFAPYGFSAVAVEKLLSASPGKILYSTSHRLLCDREVFILSPRKKEEDLVYTIDLNNSQQQLPIKLTWKLFKGFSKKLWTADQAALDKNLLKNPLLLRKSKTGDYFYPSGMKGKKLLSKYFKDEKYSLIDKEEQWVLCSDSAIVWVVGKRCDQRFIATDKTTETLVLNCKL